MAKVYFEGIQRLHFTNKQGDEIKGYNLHIAYPDENVVGRITDKKFINDEAFNNLGFSLDKLSALVQKDVELETNIKGKVIAISAAK